MENNELIFEVILDDRHSLNEGLSEKVYHFCPLEACYNILKSNKIVLSSVRQNSNNDKRMNSLPIGKEKNGKTKYKIYPYYFCLTRTPSTADGYVRSRRENDGKWKTATVRIEFNGELLNANYAAKPVNAFIDPNDSRLSPAKEGIYYKMPKDPGLFVQKKYQNVDNSMIIPMSYEHEDRILSNKSEIENAKRYIKEIDILLHPDILRTPEKYPTIYRMLNTIIRNCGYDYKVYIYNNEKAFNSSHIRDSIDISQFSRLGKRKNKEELINQMYKHLPVDTSKFKKEYSEYLHNNEVSLTLNSSDILGIATILGVLSYNEKTYKNDLYKENALKTARYVGVGKYSDEIMKNIPNLNEWGYSAFLGWSRYFNGYMTSLTKKFPKISKAINNIVKKQEAAYNVQIFYAKAKLHKQLFGF